jgi:YjbE family integral membrane protein
MEREFWIGFLQIIWIDVLLSGDNAVVIALVCRSLPSKQRVVGIALGAGAAIGLRIVFATFIAYLMAVPLLSIVGGLLLFWIAVKLVAPEQERRAPASPAAGLWAAIRIIVVADAVMSLDNVIAITAASDGSILLLAFGLFLSIPLVVFGSALILRLIEWSPLTVYAGGGLLGWIAGDTLVTDPAVVGWVARSRHLLITRRRRSARWRRSQLAGAGRV